MPGGGPPSGAEVARIVQVAAVDHAGEAALARDLRQASVQLVLAVEAAGRAVGHVLRVVHLLRVDQLVGDADAARQRLRLLYLRRRDRRRDACYRQRALAEDVAGDGGDEGGVDAARIGDDDGAHPGDGAFEGGELGGEGVSHNAI